jgi:hypothetical protein
MGDSVTPGCRVGEYVNFFVTVVISVIRDLHFIRRAKTSICIMSVITLWAAAWDALVNFKKMSVITMHG